VAALPNRRLSTPASRLLADVARRDGVAAVRLAALGRLVAHGSGLDFAELLRARATEDPDEEVFAAAASAALDAGDIGELRQLISGRADDDNPQVRAAAVRLLVERLPRSAYHVIAERLHDDPHPAVFAAAAEHAVARYADEPDLQDLLLGRLTDEDSEIRCTAVRALGRWARTDPAIRRNLVERAADSGDVPVQRTAVSVLDVAAALPDVKRMLIERTADADWSVRVTAVLILGRRFPNDPAVRDVLVHHARNADEPEFRRAAEWSLTWTGDPDIDDFPDR
jgi:HEAT repeat protein